MDNQQSELPNEPLSALDVVRGVLGHLGLPLADEAKEVGKEIHYTVYKPPSDPKIIGIVHTLKGRLLGHIITVVPSGPRTTIRIRRNVVPNYLCSVDFPSGGTEILAGPVSEVKTWVFRRLVSPGTLDDPDMSFSPREAHMDFHGGPKLKLRVSLVDQTELLKI